MIRILVFVVAFLCAATGAFAADLGVRVNDHGRLVRVVLQWPTEAIPAHTVRVVDDRTVEVAFDSVAEVAPFHPVPDIPEIVDIRRVSEPDGPLKIWILLADALYRRDLQVGQRLILDLNQSQPLRAKVARAAAATISVPLAPVPSAPVPEEKMETAAVKKPESISPRAMIPVPVETVRAEAVKPVPFTVDPTDPPVLTFASTDTFGFAALISHGTLFVVIDDPGYVGTPKISGKNSNQLPPFDRRMTKDATIFLMPLPDGLRVMRGEGGDLLWRLVMAPSKPESKPLEFSRDQKDGRQCIVIPVQNATKIIEVPDPKTGETHIVVTVKKSDEYLGSPRRFAEFFVPQTPVGIAVTPRVDDLRVTTGKNEIIIMRGDGLSITSSFDAEIYRSSDLQVPPSVAETLQETVAEVNPDVGAVIQQLSSETGTGLPLFRFDRWAMGGASALILNETALIADMAGKKPEERGSGLMNIGKMYLANGRGGEAAGYFRLAGESTPGLLETPEYLGLRGAAYALNSQFDLAYDDLRIQSLDVYPDIGIWRAYALAHLQDWQQASVRMGKDISWARQYPSDIGRRMIMTFAEIALRAGKPKEAMSILSQIDPSAGVTNADQEKKQGEALPLPPSVSAQFDYLNGESARQSGDKETARKLWERLMKSPDDKFRARARLALTVMDFEEGKIKAEEAIDHLESLRYAWRGDEIEAAIYARLGEVYIQKGDYLRGLNALKDATSMAGDTDFGRRVTANMADSFRSMFVGDQMKKVDPLEAITVYEKFSELVPAGVESNRLTLSLVDRLMDVDLLDRAAKVLEDMVERKLEGDARVDAAFRLAAIYLLNAQPQKATTTLNRAGEMFAAISDVTTLEKRKRELSLLRARAQFQLGQVESALSTLSILPEDATVLRARTDIAWQTARWSEAATALEKLLGLNPVLKNKPPTPEQAEIVRNLAVATNLSGDRGGLQRLRSQYEQAMTQTEMSQEFDVITRERQTPTLADRDTLNRLVSEVDLFGTFLNVYRQTAPTSAPASVPTGAPSQSESQPAAPDPENGTQEAD